MVLEMIHGRCRTDVSEDLRRPGLVFVNSGYEFFVFGPRPGRETGTLVLLRKCHVRNEHVPVNRDSNTSITNGESTSDCPSHNS